MNPKLPNSGDINDASSQLGFTSNEDAEIAVDNILSQIRLFKNFVIQECPDINNAVAKMIDIGNVDKARYILYDSESFKCIEDKAANDWPATSILAYKIGLHLMMQTSMAVSSLFLCKHTHQYSWLWHN